MELLLFIAGIVAGAFNALAGGGSFVAFPTLVFFGLPPLIANATNTFAACPGYLSGLYGYRQALRQHKSRLVRIIIYSLCGGLLGAECLLWLGHAHFDYVVAWLMLLASIMFIQAQRIHLWLAKRHSSERLLMDSPSGALATVLVSLYGGFFNAGQGLLFIVVYSVLGLRNVHEVNALKLLSSAMVALIAIARFASEGIIDWYAGFWVLVGSILGAYGAAHYSQQIPAGLIRKFIIVICVLTTCYFFIKLID